ncbi:TPA: MarR family transcriptional regulator [Staphylococcus aureus]|uniref:MarR family transcriptional regulator MhqR n=1 Tax=Staphylococcus TaxID=1279 RepID=UPI000241DEFB|nr:MULTISPECIES: MarR family transcriptional regulator [Staphylococcus]HDK9094030.1 MarR family transcriptional regulator [Staphylococcus aureus CC80-24329]AEW66478.1 penicillinase repressor family protein [Staphylococcus aureus subsp. aureus 11819-97]ALF34229.1 MarR family transcriptional regulator [Staphylococcus aureus]EHP01415.1 sugar-specific transcriptional regulator, TrmB family [Staphylococcus aureus subsp. aureus 21333]EJX3503263.1 MarR family transcriptional regulator [Staphylococcus
MDRTKQSLNVFVGMNRALDTLEQITKEDVKRYGLNITEFAVLELLYNKGPQPIQRIRDRVLIASSSISYVVSQLEDKDWITREKDKDDKRVYMACLTEKGQSQMADIFPKHAETLTKAFDVLTKDELTILQQAFKKLSAQSTEV